MSNKLGWIQVSKGNKGIHNANWCWIPGWSFSGTVFSDLYTRIPGNHWIADYRTSELSMSEAGDALANTLPENAHIIGWSLGGALGMKIAALKKPTSITTLATSAYFIARPNSEQLGGMPADVFAAFSQSLATQPEKTLKRFLGLCAQHADNPKALIRTLSAHQYNISDSESSTKELAQTLAWLAEYDLSNQTLAVEHQAHWVGSNDGLHPVPLMCSPDSSHQEPLITFTAKSHAFFACESNQQQIADELMSLISTRGVHDNA